MISVLLRGILLGLCIAAPVGPIGILCIHRTLTGGRLIGFVTGLGAATADAGYGAVAALGLTLVSDHLVRFDGPLRTGGGMFLLWLAYRAASTPPPAHHPAPEGAALGRAYASTFLLTATNPATILSFGAVFASMGASLMTRDHATAVALIVGVFLGSALWWLMLSTVIAAFRERLAARMCWVGLGSAFALGAFGVWALAT